MNTPTDCTHEWKEEYYGVRCPKCNTFYPYGSEPWLPLNDDIEGAQEWEDDEDDQ